MSNDLNPLYGLWSVTDRCWVGPTNSPLPLLYSNSVVGGEPITGFQQAYIDARILTERFKNTKQIEAKVYDGTAKQTIESRVTPGLTARQAIDRIERKAMKKHEIKHPAKR